MSTVQPSAGTTGASEGSGIVLGLKITSILLTVGLLVQAWLGSAGLFEAEPDLITAHEMLANVFFLVAAIQLVLAYLALRKGLATMLLPVISILLLVDVVAQIGLGYGTRDSATAIAWHLPNGVLLMGFCTLSLVLAWMRPSNRA